jgi:hypothetical protein
MAAARSRSRSHSSDAKNDARDVSFIDYARSGGYLDFLHAIFNSANINVIELMVTPHGEIYVGPDGTAPQQVNSGVKISTINFARPGVVNWSDDTVNKIALKTIERFATNEREFQSLLDILTTGTAPNPPPFGLSVDEIIFACTLRIMYLLEMSDRVHQGPMTYKIRKQEDLLPGSESLGATEHSFTLNFFTNKPMITQRNLGPGESPVQIPMTEDFGTLCVNIFKGKTIKRSRLEKFSNLLHSSNIRILLPTVVQLPKLYTLSRDEHRSRYKTTTPALSLLSEVRKEKGLEHKVVALSKLHPDITSNDAFISYVKYVLSSNRNRKIDCYNWMAGDGRMYKNVKYDQYIGKITDLPGVFDDQFNEDINDPSTVWNKLCIIFSLSGTTKGALVQWRVQTHLGVPHLVFNIWNLISGKAGISQTTLEAGYSTATTYDIMKFVRDIFKGNITRILDITCQVEGGLPNTAWIVSKDPLAAEGIFKSRILSLHPSGTRAITPRTSTDVARSDFFSGLSNISTIFDACRDDSSAALTSLVTAPPTAHHLGTSEQSSFLSVVPVLSKLLNDSQFTTSGISSFGVSLEVKLLKQNPDIAQRVDISDTHDLRHFGICVCRYIHDMAHKIYRFIPPLKSDPLNHDMVSELHRLLELFHDAIYYLNIKQSTFVIHQTGDIESDLRLSHATVALKKKRKTFNRLDARLEGLLEGSDRRRQSIQESKKYREAENLRNKAESIISKLLEQADEYDKTVGPLNRVSKTLHDTADFTYDPSSPKVTHLTQKIPGIIATIRAIIAYCQPPPVGGPGGGGGSRNYKKYKSRKTKWSLKRKTRNRLSYRRRRIVVNTTKRK